MEENIAPRARKRWQLEVALKITRHRRRGGAEMLFERAIDGHTVYFGLPLGNGSGPFK